MSDELLKPILENVSLAGPVIFRYMLQGTRRCGYEANTDPGNYG